ncbi:hypothetical protein, partial [Salmonella enterica]|uniref:hypothetical protein n=1 Tax=Salmonella enterica TaxID=28901 RepID=UPI0032979A59
MSGRLLTCHEARPQTRHDASGLLRIREIGRQLGTHFWRRLHARVVPLFLVDQLRRFRVAVRVV